MPLTRSTSRTPVCPGRWRALAAAVLAAALVVPVSAGAAAAAPAAPAAPGAGGRQPAAAPGPVATPLVEIRRRDVALPRRSPRSGSTLKTADDGTQALLVSATASGTPRSTWEVTYSGFDPYPEARAAFQAAVDIWARTVASSVPIKVNANFAALPAGVLGSAGSSTNYPLNDADPGGPIGTVEEMSYYPSALADAVTGTDQSARFTGAPPHDIEATFTSATSANFYFGTDGAPGSGQIDFMTVVMHELGHGLGFFGSMTVARDGTGSYGLGDAPWVAPVPYDRDAFDAATAGQPLTAQVNPSPALGAVLLSERVHWDGAEARTANLGARPRLYAPTTWEGGSSFSHLDEATYGLGHPDSLMTPFVSAQEAIHAAGPLAEGILRDQGWTMAPAAPAKPTAIAADSAASVSWTAPSDGGSAITGYTATSSPEAKSCTTTATSCRVAGLSNGTAYTFTVTATNVVGTSDPSAASDAVTPAPATAPAAPAKPTAAAGDGSAAVSWLAPHDGGSAITGYTVTSAPGGVVCTTSTTSCTVTGLSNGTSHTFTVVAANAVGASQPSTASEPVVPMPSVTVGDAVVREGDAGSVSVLVPVRLSRASSVPVSFAYAGAAGTAGGADFAAAPGTVSFGEGQTTATVKVVIRPDSLDEPAESFTLGLSAPVGATVADGTGTVTILDNDSKPRLTASDVRVWEGDSGTAKAVFTVRLSAPLTTDTAVQFSTAGGSATSGTDFTARSGSLTFAAGQVSKTVAVSVRADSLDESSETFTLGLSGAPTTVSVADRTGLATVLDDDPAGTSTTPQLQVGDLTLVEGGTGTTKGTLTVRLSRAVSTEVSASYVREAGTAGSADAVLGTGTISIPAGATSASVPIAVRGDAIDEPTEAFRVRLTSASGASLGDATGAVKVRDDDAPASLAVSDAEVVEGDDGTRQVALTVRLTAPTAAEVSVGYATQDGTATSAGDYSASSGTVTFAPGQVTRSVTFTTTADDALEAKEAFTVLLQHVTGARVSDGTGQIALVDDDA